MRVAVLGLHVNLAPNSELHRHATHCHRVGRSFCAISTLRELQHRHLGISNSLRLPGPGCSQTKSGIIEGLDSSTECPLLVLEGDANVRASPQLLPLLPNLF